LFLASFVVTLDEQNVALMKAPMSELARRILADRELSKKLMIAIQSERRNPGDVEGRTIVVDGKRLTLTRATANYK
jgi:hypothetical protein